jgi:hypothetical protein
MSDSEPVDTGPADGIAPDTGVSEAEAPQAEPEYLDVDSYGGHHVRLKVDGQEVAVPLSEALGGYQRQADYTRKTQELAELQRQAQFGLTLQQALEANPAETMRILQAQYQAEQAQAEQPDQPEWTDPDEQRWQEMDSRLRRYEQQQADNELRQAIGVLQQRYGDDFDPKEVVQTAFQQQRMDLENVYKEIAFDRYRQGVEAANKQRSDEEAARMTAKTETGNIHSGNGAANTAAPPSDSSLTIEEAFAEAKRQHGWVS